VYLFTSCLPLFLLLVYPCFYFLFIYATISNSIYWDFICGRLPLVYFYMHFFLGDYFFSHTFASSKQNNETLKTNTKNYMKTKFVSLTLLVLFTFNNNVKAISEDNTSDYTEGEVSGITDDESLVDNDPLKGPRKSKRMTNVISLEQVGHTLIFDSLFYGCELQMIGETGETVSFHINDEDGVVCVPETVNGVYSLYVLVGNTMYTLTITL